MPDTTSPPLRVVIPEDCPTRNRGEAAILEGIRTSLGACGSCELTVYSPPHWIEDDTAYSIGEYQVVGGLNVFGETTGRVQYYSRWGLLLLYSMLHRLSPRTAAMLSGDPHLHAIGDADLIVAGHDGCLSPLLFYLALAARIMNKPVAFFGGSGSTGRYKWRWRKYLQFLVKNAILCTVRDQCSKDVLMMNDVPSDQVQVFPDPAVLLKPCEDARTLEILQAEGIPSPEAGPLYGLVPVRGGIVAWTSFSAERDEEKKHELRVELWKQIARHLLDTTNAHLVFLPHCTGPTRANDDRRMNRDIYDAISDSKNRITVIDTMYRAGELKGIMKLCDFVLGERAHALIGAVSVATPCVALTTEEDRRMHCIIRDAFDRVTYNLNAPQPSQLMELLTEEWDKRGQTREVMKRKATEIHDQALEAARLLHSRISSALAKRAKEGANNGY